MHFKVGDKVRLAQVEHLTEEDKARSPKWVTYMDKYSGAVGVIIKVISSGVVKLTVHDGQFNWSTRWFTKEA